jgi:uracil-DNA glycosylase
MEAALADVLAAARECVVCAEHLPFCPRPVLAGHVDARIAVIGQAPGTREHDSGVHWDDVSGDLLRGWLEVDEATFRDAVKFAILPMGFCYPGKREGGDAPPRPECAPLWHPPLLAAMPNIRLTLLVGENAQRHYLGAGRKMNPTATVHAFDKYLPTFFPLPQPTWRNHIWMARNPWFASDALPALRREVSGALE